MIYSHAATLICVKCQRVSQETLWHIATLRLWRHSLRSCMVGYCWESPHTPCGGNTCSQVKDCARALWIRQEIQANPGRSSPTSVGPDWVQKRRISKFWNKGQLVTKLVVEQTWKHATFTPSSHCGFLSVPRDRHSHQWKRSFPPTSLSHFFPFSILTLCDLAIQFLFLYCVTLKS